MPQMSPTVRVDQHGAADAMYVTELPVGDPGPGEIRIRHHACGLNFIDVYQRSGVYQLPMPLSLGMEAAGVVEAVGEGVTHLKAGDRAAYASAPPGSYCELRVMPAKTVCKLPDAISFETGAAMMLKGLTVQYLLVRTSPQGGLRAGDTIVWHAAAGGVGLIAVQWAKALGLRVIGTAGGPDKCELAKRHGADEMIDYHREDVVARVRELTGGKGVKIVFDSVGKDTFDRSLDCLAPFGLLAAFGNASGAIPPFDILTLSRKGSLYVTRPTLGTHTKEHLAEMARDLFAVVASGKVKIDVQQRYPLAEAGRAHAELEGRKTTGASVLIP